MLFPERLKQGDTIGIIAPASPPDETRLHNAIPFFENMGLHVKLGKNIYQKYGYLAGTDEERLADFHEMIADPCIKALFFARGGYGTPRLAAQIDYNLICQNPKIIWGYSDITYMHTAIRQQTGLITFHGPMPASDIADEAFDVLSAQSFQQLFEPLDLVYGEDIAPLEVIVPGYAIGPIVGGNLSLLVSSLATPFELDTKGKILLIEDIGEAPYEIDSMLNQLTLAGKLANVHGVMIGDFAKAESKAPTLSLEEIFAHYFGNLRCPVMSGFKIGHCFPHFAVALGVHAMMDTTSKTIIIGPGVK